MAQCLKQFYFKQMYQIFLFKRINITEIIIIYVEKSSTHCFFLFETIGTDVFYFMNQKDSSTNPWEKISENV